MDSTLLEAWASHKSFRPKDGHDDDDGDDFHGQRRSDDTHASTTDPDARLIRKGKGKEARLSYLANTLMKNRNGLIVDVDVRHASGTRERDGALDLLAAAGVKQRATLGADKGYDTQDFVAALTHRPVVGAIADVNDGGIRASARPKIPPHGSRATSDAQIKAMAGGAEWRFSTAC